MKDEKRAVIYAVLAVLCWSTVATAFKISLFYLTPSQLLLIASVTTSCLLLLILRWQGRLSELWQQSPKSYGYSLVLGILNPLLYYLVLFRAYELLPAQEAQAINYSWALVLSLLSVPFLGHRLHRADLLAALICYFGVLVIATRGDLLGLSFSNIQGVALALLSTLIWASYWIAKARDTRDPVIALCLSFCFSLPMLLLWSWHQGELVLIPLQGLAGGIYVGLFEMGIAFVLWSYAMKLTDRATRIANLIFLSPFLSLVLIALILKEPIYLSTLAGLACILSGLMLQSRSQ